MKPSIESESMTCSALFVEPKPPFFEWLAQVLTVKRVPTTVNDVYFPQEDPVWLIPYVPRFSSQAQLASYLEGLKSKLLEFHLSAFVTDTALLPRPLDAATFDRFFAMKLHDSVKDIRTLDSFANSASSGPPLE